MNEFVSITVWEWPDSLDWEKMRQMQERHMKDAPEGTSVRWFQINEKTMVRF